ncbi:ABC transporter substrate-binding protein [Oceanobacillus sp. FSL W8-0428]|uniref:Iron-uptake system-binding protein n=1 Tax=Oceanobacillus sojae TaxID=582851 RepID=A0A511ZH95_9BACI|nr:ABC transporter substrate-binding protein [Oceanobacillus sojae]GEN86816.1 iron-uptake system-binding protein [Oceanobacillus sojae]
MNKKFLSIFISIVFFIMLAACGQNSDSPEKDENKAEAGEEETAAPEENATQTIEYLGEEYTVPANVERIVITGAMEAMEDAVLLEVNPVGAVTVAGEFPEVYSSAMGNAESIGEKQEPNFEKILELQPDVILGTTKFPEEVIEKLEKIAPTILVSHISSDGEANLQLMAALAGKEEQADQILTEYQENVEAAKSTLTEQLADEKAAAVRIRGGEMFVYPEDVFFNTVLYGELGLEVPEEVQKAEAQEAISVEQLADMNPDYLFLQIPEGADGESSQIYEDIQANPILQNVEAFKNDHVYVNVVDPLLEGGPIYSRVLFLEQLRNKIEE